MMKSDEEFFELMRRAGVKPLAGRDKKSGSELIKLKTAPKVPLTKKIVQPPKRLKFKRPKISRGFEPDLTLDLHGLTLNQALVEAEAALARAFRLGFSHILFITGKGLNSGVEGGVLGPGLWDYLTRLIPGKIAQIERAPVYLGGSGAILVFLYSAPISSP